jgi:hypothetical protein
LFQRSFTVIRATNTILDEFYKTSCQPYQSYRKRIFRSLSTSPPYLEHHLFKPCIHITHVSDINPRFRPKPRHTAIKMAATFTQQIERSMRTDRTHGCCVSAICYSNSRVIRYTWIYLIFTVITGNLDGLIRAFPSIGLRLFHEDFLM